MNVFQTWKVGKIANSPLAVFLRLSVWTRFSQVCSRTYSDWHSYGTRLKFCPQSIAMTDPVVMCSNFSLRIEYVCRPCFVSYLRRKYDGRKSCFTKFISPSIRPLQPALSSTQLICSLVLRLLPYDVCYRTIVVLDSYHPFDDTSQHAFEYLFGSRGRQHVRLNARPWHQALTGQQCLHRSHRGLRYPACDMNPKLG